MPFICPSTVRKESDGEICYNHPKSPQSAKQRPYNGRKGGSTELKALSIHPYYAQAIVSGQKSIEVRSWTTNYRGDIVICSTQKKYHGTVPGHALGVVRLVDVVPMQKKHCKDALMKSTFDTTGQYAWILTDNRLIVPQPVKGKLSLWEYTGTIEYIPESEWICAEDDIEKAGAWVEKYWKPIMT